MPPHLASPPSGGEEPEESVTSLERRRIEQATLGPQLVGAALQLEGRAHAHGALVAFAVVSDLLDGVEHPVVGEAHHLAELALGAEQAADLGARRLGLHLLDVLRRHAQRPSASLALADRWR